MITLKSKHDIERLAEGGKILCGVLDKLEREVKEGAVPKELDLMAGRLIREAGCEPSFLNYAPGGHDPYPAALCVSINDAIVHGLPGKTSLRTGDVVGIDLGLIFENKYYLDSARTICVGEADDEIKKLLEVTKESLWRGIEASKIGNRVGDISAAVQSYVEAAGFEVIRELVGHGVGYAVHEPPQVPNFGAAGRGEKLKEGLVIAIEPMVTTGDPAVETGADGWSVRVKTGSKTAHFEHTVAVTKSGPLVLTAT